MSRKRDTNWTRDEISVLLDSIMEITRTRADDGKRTNSREVFEHAAKRMAERGHNSRADREKCRTKWKKMKEEFTYAKRAREGDTRYKEAPGIQPFYDRLEEFINGNFDNISPHSTIVRRSSSISSNATTSITTRSSPGSRTSARIAANTNGTAMSHENNDTSSTMVTKQTNNSLVEFPSSAIQTPSNSSSSSRQNSRLSSTCNTTSITTTNNHGNNTNMNNNSLNNNLFPATSVASTTSSTTDHIQHIHNHQQLQPAIPDGDICIYSSYNHNNVNNNNGTTSSNNNTSITSNGNNNNSGKNMLNSSNDSMHQLQPAEQADISYRVSSGCRQITIFGDHDVDIKFRGDCVTINKISADYTTTTTSSTPTET